MLMPGRHMWVKAPHEFSNRIRFVTLQLSASATDNGDRPGFEMAGGDEWVSRSARQRMKTRWDFNVARLVGVVLLGVLKRLRRGQIRQCSTRKSSQIVISQRWLDL